MKIDAKSEERFSVLYHVTVHDNRPIEAHAEDITIEQTVEVPRDVIPEGHWQQGIVGAVESIEQLPHYDQRYAVTISYKNEVACSLPQFLNVIFGNISLKDNIRVSGLGLNRSVLKLFPGPNFGTSGIRKRLGVYNRPLTMTALKPLGRPVQELAELAHSFATGGIDFVKDDHGLSDQAFHPFEERVRKCHEAVSEASEKRGHPTLYCPMITGTPWEVEQRLTFCRTIGIEAVMMAPMLVGSATVADMTRKTGMIIVAHPSFAGAYCHSPVHGISHSVLFGTLFRLLGGDVSIFPNAGGRFPFSREDCRDLSAALQEPLHDMAPSSPSPAGGMQLDTIKEMTDEFGIDTMLLIGGALLQQPGNLAETASRFMERIYSLFPEHTRETPELSISSCEYAGAQQSTPSGPADLLRFDQYLWEGREKQAYKATDMHSFRGIARTELIGKTGEKTSFDLRYFEIEPQGYSSFEKHAHEHVSIGVRGLGVLSKEDSVFSIGPNDIARVNSFAPHQLKNDSPEPFGFYCIVDRTRDKPIIL